MKAVNTDKQQRILEKVYADIESVNPAYYERMERRNRNYDFYFGRQRTEAEIEMLDEQGRKNIIFNEIQPKVNHLIGTQTQLRMSSMVKGRERNDDAEAKILTEVLRYVEEVNDIDQTETKVFSETAVGGYGASQVRWERDTTSYGFPIIEKIPMNELRWDGQAKKDDYSDARWMARVIEVMRAKAKDVYPEWADIIDETSSAIDGGGNINYRFNNVKSVTQELVQDYEITTYDDYDRELVPIIEHYEAIIKPEYHVLNGVSGETYKFDSPKEARDFKAGLEDEYTKDGHVLVTAAGDELIAIDIYRKKRIIQTIIIGDKVVSSEEIGLPEFPYVICTGYFDEGYSIGFVDNLIGPQIFYNDTLSMLDYIIGTSSKGALTVMPQLLHKDTTVENMQIELSKARPIIKVNQHGAIQPLQTPNPLPELYNNMTLATQYMVTAVGGMNALGLQQNASESGKAIEMRAQAGGTGRLPLFDSLKKWRKNVSLRLLWWIKNYMTPDQILRIIGYDSETNPYVDITELKLNTLDELQFDIVIDEVNKTSTVRQTQFQQMQQLFIQSGISPDVYIPTLLKYSDLSKADQDSILANNALYKDYMQQQAQVAEQQKMQTEAERELQKRVVKDQLKEDSKYQTKNDAKEIEKTKLKEQEQAIKNQMAEMPLEQLQQLNS
jgi:hypothetical protein